MRVAEAGDLDFLLEDHGTLYVLRPLSQAAEAWVEEHVGQDSGYQPLWPAVVVEPRYVDDIVEGIRGDGLTVEHA